MISCPPLAAAAASVILPSDSVLEEVSVAEGGVVSEGVVVRLVLHNRVEREVEDSLQGVADARRGASVVGGSVPDGEDVLVDSDRDNSSADLVSHHELLTQDREDQILPTAVRESLLESDDPLASQTVRLILPHRLDAVAEEMQVRVGAQFARPHDVRVQAPEGLDGRKGPHQLQVLVIGGWVHQLP